MNVYSVKRLVSPEIEIKGKLLPYQDKVVFEPDEEDAIRIEIPIGKIKDVRFATEKDIDALRVAFFGIVTGIFWKKKHNILLIDFEDEYGIIQHLTFEGDNDIEYAENELYDIRKVENEIENYNRHYQRNRNYQRIQNRNFTGNAQDVKDRTH